MMWRDPWDKSSIPIPYNGYDYIIYKEGDYVLAKNGRTGEIVAQSDELGESIQAVYNESHGDAIVFITHGEYEWNKQVTLKTASDVGVPEYRFCILSDGARIYANAVVYPNHLLYFRPSTADFKEDIILHGFTVIRDKATKNVPELFSISAARWVIAEQIKYVGNSSLKPDVIDSFLVGYNNLHVRVRNCSFKYVDYGAFIGGITAIMENNYCEYCPTVAVEPLGLNDNIVGASDLKNKYNESLLISRGNYAIESGYKDLAFGADSHTTTLPAHAIIEGNELVSETNMINTGIQVALSGNGSSVIIRNNKIKGVFKVGYDVYKGADIIIAENNTIEGSWKPAEFDDSPFTIINYKRLKLINNNIIINSLNTDNATPSAYAYLGGIQDGGVHSHKWK